MNYENSKRQRREVEYSMWIEQSEEDAWYARETSNLSTWIMCSYEVVWQSRVGKVTECPNEKAEFKVSFASHYFYEYFLHMTTKRLILEARHKKSGSVFEVRHGRLLSESS